MLVRASVHTCGLAPGEVGERNGNDRAVRASLNAGFLERVSDEPAFDDSPMLADEPTAGELAAEDAAEGEPGQDD